MLRRATKGRPKSTRYLNEMDSRDMCGPRRCTICGREGHSRSRCPQRAGSSSARVYLCMRQTLNNNYEVR
ncbi:hypothetical protein Ahy_A10g047442 [Arachis hypogaea]|uniref:CCHC-type domain-containing protein n=1 Tax=Arachis hypogaea TaxID=3818 RepID=A0A445B2K0_ARAHY|nr:hypothetical protein Ahy_A10g047442 [Arachis hypogaea]